MAVEKTVPPLPFKSPLIDNRGFITTPWEKFLRQLFIRAGGNVALTNLELEAQIDAGTNPLPQSTHPITGGQAATNLTDETIDHTAYLSAIYFAEFTRGATVMSSVIFALQYIGGAWNVINLVTGTRSSQITKHGITFTMNGDQMRAAATAGDDGQVKFKKIRFAVA